MTQAAARRRVVAFPSGDAIALLEAGDVDALLERAVERGGDAPYGAVLWPSAVVLADHLLTCERLAGVRALELGAGTGLCSLAAAVRGADVLATDDDEAALALLSAAASAGGLQVRTARLDVHDERPLPEADVVMLADVMYEPGLALGMARRAREALARGARVLVADPGRAFRPIFVDVLQEAGVEVRFERREVRVRHGEIGAPLEPARADVAVLAPGGGAACR